MDLKSQLLQPLPKYRIDLIANMAVDKNLDVKKLIDLTFDADEQVGFRAAWILENVFTQKPERFAVHFKHFVACFPKQENLSARRHFSKIMALATGKKAITQIKDAQFIDLTLVVETTFDWLMGETPVAIKSHCLGILANLAPRYPWIKDELIQTMDYLVDKESVAFFAKVKQVRKQLGRHKSTG